MSYVWTSNFYERSSFQVSIGYRHNESHWNLEQNVFSANKNLQIASLCSALRVNGNPMTSRDWSRVESVSGVVPAIFYTHARTRITCAHVVAVTSKLIHT